MHCGWGKQAVGALVALAVLVLPAVFVVGATAEPALASGGLRESATSTFVVDPAAGAVHATVDLTVTNTEAGYYYTGVYVAALSEATNLRGVSASGAALSVRSTPAAVSIAQQIEVRFASSLFYNQTQTVHLSYDLPNGAPRSAAHTRVTAAFSVFQAWAMGDPGAANVSILVPKSFEVDVVGESMSKQIDQTNIIYSATAIKDPDRWAVAVSARDDSQLAKRHLKVDGREVSIRAMPDDQVWGTFVESRVSKGLPKLHDLLGLPWSNLSLLVITETVTPYLYGYAGWYTPNDNTIEVGDELDAQVILHELSHIWFNDTLFSARWIDEGFAQDYGSRAVAQLGERLDVPQPVDTRARGAVALDSWSSVNLQDENSDARERFGYNASWFVLRKLTAEIGITRMQRVLEAASTNELPYAGHQSQSGGSEAVTTRRFLDYLEEIGGSKVAEDLFSKYVMTADGRKNLVKRRQARESYKKLVTASGRWDTPLTIRSDMSDWSFTTALRHIEIATAVTAARDEIDRTLRPLGLRTPLRLQVDYENGSGELGALKVRALAAVETAKELVRAESAVKESHGIFATVGLIGATHERDLARARTSFKDGDAEQARTWALAAEQTVADASGAGIQRVGAAVGLVVLLVLLGWGVRTWRRRRARRAAERAAAAALLADTELDPEPGTDPDAQNEPVTPWPSG